MNGDVHSATAPRRRFHLKKRIGSGAFGEVFLAEQDSGAGFRRPVALKVLNPDAVRSKDAARRMRDEARILGRLSHRNIVSVLDLVRLGDRWAVVMDYVEGADLEQVTMALGERHEHVPAAAALEIGAAVCRALHAAWHADDGKGGRLQVVHRDIKPSNIRLTPDGDVKVLDFGVARVDLDTREAKTRAEGWIGTERYMAPERITLDGDGPWGDVYALGASVIEMIQVDPLGRTPVVEPRHQAMVDAALARVRERLAGPPEIVERACALLSASVASDPQARPTAEALADGLADLARRLDGETLTQFARRFVPQVDGILGKTAETVDGVLSEGTELTTPPTVGPTSGAVAIPEPPAPTMALGEPEEAPRSRPMLWMLGAAAVVVALTVAGVAVAGGAWVMLGAGQLPAIGAHVAPEPPAVVTDPTAPEPPVVVPPAPEPPEAPPPEVPPPAPTLAEPTPAGAPKPAPRPRPSTPPAPVEPVVPAAGPRVSAAAFAVQDADAVQVVCSGVTQTGTASVRMRDFPAGPCSVQATYLGRSYTTTIDVQRRSEVRCAVADGRLTCAP